MTEAEHVDLRLKLLEEAATGARQIERQVDLLKIDVPRLDAQIKEFRAEASARHDSLHASVTRLHGRLDQMAADEYREQGARQERAKLGRLGMAFIGAGTMIGGLVVGVLSVVIQNS